MFKALKIYWNVRKLELPYDNNISKRCLAAQNLGKLSDVRALGPLLHILSVRDDKAVHHEVINALINIGDKRAIPALIEVLGSTDNSIRLATANALDRLGEHQWKTLIKGTASDFERLASTGDMRVIKAIIRAVGEYDIEKSIKIAAIKALAQVNNEDAIESIVKIINLPSHLSISINKESDVRGAAIQTLSKLKAQRAVIPLMHLVNSGIMPLRITTNTRAKVGYDISIEVPVAADALAEIGNASALPALLRFLEAAKKYKDIGTPDQSHYFRKATESIIKLANSVQSQIPTDRLIHIQISYLEFNLSTDQYDIKKIDQKIPWPFTEEPPTFIEAKSIFELDNYN